MKVCHKAIIIISNIKFVLISYKEPPIANYDTRVSDEPEFYHEKILGALSIFYCKKRELKKEFFYQ